MATLMVSLVNHVIHEVLNDSLFSCHLVIRNNYWGSMMTMLNMIFIVTYYLELYKSISFSYWYNFDLLNTIVSVL